MSTDTKRQPKGIPVGGQFAATAHAEPDLTLSAGIEEFSFAHNDISYEVERDGEDYYTVYAATDEGDEISSFTFDGDPSDQEGLTAAAIAALEEQKARLGAVSTRGAHVIWTDPDGLEQHKGRVVCAIGEIITVSLASGGEAEVFGNELTVDDASAQAHRAALSKIDAPVLWTDPMTGEKVVGHSIGEVDRGQYGFQVTGQGGFTAVPAEQLTVQPEVPRPPVKFVETQRRIRGHNFFPPKAIMSKVPALGATQDVPFEDKKVHLHYFTGAADWYLMEVDQSTGKAFGFLNPDGRGGHWGYVSIPELEKVNLGGYRVVERDCHFSQGTLAEVTRNR